MLGDNLLLFSLSDEATRRRIIENQPWKYRGSVILLERSMDSGRADEFSQHKVPFWV